MDDPLIFKPKGLFLMGLIKKKTKNFNKSNIYKNNTNNLS